MIIKRKKAIIFDEKGEYETTVKIPKHGETFNYANKSYNFNAENSYIKNTGLIFITKTYFFNKANTDGLKLLQQPSINVLEPELYNIYLQNNLARKLSDTGKPSFLAGLFDNPKAIFIVLIALAIGYYLFSGGTIS